MLTNKQKITTDTKFNGTGMKVETFYKRFKVNQNKENGKIIINKKKVGE